MPRFLENSCLIGRATIFRKEARSDKRGSLWVSVTPSPWFIMARVGLPPLVKKRMWNGMPSLSIIVEIFLSDSSHGIIKGYWAKSCKSIARHSVRGLSCGRTARIGSLYRHINSNFSGMGSEVKAKSSLPSNSHCASSSFVPIKNSTPLEDASQEKSRQYEGATALRCLDNFRCGFYRPQCLALGKYLG